VQFECLMKDFKERTRKKKQERQHGSLIRALIPYRRGNENNFALHIFIDVMGLYT
jgi:hypothetical protein